MCYTPHNSICVCTKKVDARPIATHIHASHMTCTRPRPTDQPRTGHPHERALSDAHRRPQTLVPRHRITRPGTQVSQGSESQDQDLDHYPFLRFRLCLQKRDLTSGLVSELGFESFGRFAPALRHIITQTHIGGASLSAQKNLDPSRTSTPTGTPWWAGIAVRQWAALAASRTIRETQPRQLTQQMQTRTRPRLQSNLPPFSL